MTVSDEAQALLTVIDGSAGVGRGLRSYPLSIRTVLREIHELCLELQSAGLIYKRRVGWDKERQQAFYTWTATD